MNRRRLVVAGVGVLIGVLALGLTGLPAAAQAPGKKPNILVIFGDDVGQTNISAYAFGVVGYQNAYLMGWMTFHAAGFLETFVEYPPSQEPASFTIDQVSRDVERRIQEKAGKK